MLVEEGERLEKEQVRGAVACVWGGGTAGRLRLCLLALGSWLQLLRLPVGSEPSPSLCTQARNLAALTHARSRVHSPTIPHYPPTPPLATGHGQPVQAE